MAGGKESADRGSMVMPFLRIVLGSIMLGMGAASRDTCPNGAAEYLYIAGIVTVIANIMGVVAILVKYWAEKDGEVDTGEGCLMLLISIFNCGLSVTDFLLTLWGSAVVFSAYSYWSYQAEDSAKDFYCDYSAFMVAFVLLVVNWCLVPFYICCGCLSFCCKGKE